MAELFIYATNQFVNPLRYQIILMYFWSYGYIKRSRDPQNPPRNKLKNAIDYALTRQQQMSSWLKNPYLPIDNNQVERAIRPVTV